MLNPVKGLNNVHYSINVVDLKRKIPDNQLSMLNVQ